MIATPRHFFVLAFCLCCMATTALAEAPAQDLPEWDAAAETVVVFNPDFPESEALARYYAEQRGIAAERIIGIKCSTQEEISREAFDSTLLKPLRKVFQSNGWLSLAERETGGSATAKAHQATVVTESKISVLVLMHGVPSKVIRQQPNPAVIHQDEASVDSELCLLGMPESSLLGPWQNPYFAQKQRFNAMKKPPGLLLVGRLDGPSSATVRRMIDDAIAVEKEGLRGRGVIDLALKTGAYDEGEEWLRKTAETYRRSGIPFYVDRYEPLIRDHWPLPDTALYFGWYSGGITGGVATTGFKFKRGAVACHLHSFSASTIRSTTQAWVGPLLERGAAATMGNVWEPYLSFTVHFDILNARLLEGYTLAEAAWSATPGLSWMNVVLGDPLYRPFAHSAMGDDADRDYALYKALVKKHADDPDSKNLKQEVLKLADSRSNPRLLELLALLASLENKTSEGVEMLEHARALYATPSDQLRSVLYEVELLRRDKNPAKDMQARALLDKALSNEAFKGQVGAEALKLW